ncbi:Mutator family transposase [Corynebacterium propinquum]
MISELSASADDASELVKGLLQASINAGLQAEMDAHLGYSHSDRNTKAQVKTSQENNHRNGSYIKTVNSGYGAVEVTVPRDRAGTFTPRMVPKGAHRLTELDDMIVSPYAGGMTVRDICHHLSTTLGVDMSPDTISTITDAVLDEVMIWQNRQLNEFYPVIFLVSDGRNVAQFRRSKCSPSLCLLA